MKRPFRSLASPLLAAALLVLPACQRPEEAVPPADLLPKEQMASLLASLHILEAQLEGARLPSDSARALFLNQKTLLLKRQQVSDSAFQRSYRYYGVNGRDLDDIYGAVLDSLSEREKKVSKPAPAAPKPGAGHPTGGMVK